MSEITEYHEKINIFGIFFNSISLSNLPINEKIYKTIIFLERELENKNEVIKNEIVNLLITLLSKKINSNLVYYFLFNYKEYSKKSFDEFNKKYKINEYKYRDDTFIFDLHRTMSVKKILIDKNNAFINSFLIRKNNKKILLKIPYEKVNGKIKIDNKYYKNSCFDYNKDVFPVFPNVNLEHSEIIEELIK